MSSSAAATIFPQPHKRGYGELLFESDYSKDCCLLLGKRSVLAHKVVLASCSDVFRSMFFTSRMRESKSVSECDVTTESDSDSVSKSVFASASASASESKPSSTIITTVKLPDNPRAMSKLIRCCYTQKIPTTWGSRSVLQLMRLADKYMIHMLKPDFLSYFTRRISPKNAVRILKHSHNLRIADQLAEYAYYQLVGTDAISTPGVLNPLSRDQAVAIFRKLQYGMNSGLFVTQLAEYAISHQLGDDPTLRELAGFSLKTQISCMSNESLRALARSKLVAADIILDKVLETRKKPTMRGSVIWHGAAKMIFLQVHGNPSGTGLEVDSPVFISRTSIPLRVEELTPP